MSGALPDGWVELKTDEGRPYFYNSSMRKSQWTRPEATSAAAAAAAGAAQGKSGGQGVNDWEERKDPASGRVYYYSRSRKESRWTRPTTAPGQEPLPDGWVELKDPSSGKPYFYNASLKKSQWVRPVPPSSKLPEGWTENVDPASGRKYYYHPGRRESRWTLPTEETGGSGGAGGGGTAASTEDTEEKGTEAVAKRGGKKKGAKEKGKGKRGNVFAESYDADGDFTPRVVAKSDAAKELLRGILSNMFMFASLGSGQIEQIVDAMEQKDCPAGFALIKQGDTGDNFYVVDSGSFDIIVEGVGKVASRGAGTSFGELALMYNAPRNATCQASEPSSVWALDRVTFRYMIANSEGDKASQIQEGLRKVPLLSPLGSEQMARVADVVEVVEFKPDDVIIKKGDVGDAFFMVNKGDVVCTGIVSGGKNIPDVPLSVGAYFGERALLKSQPRAANVIATSDVVCFKLGRKEFTTYLGPLHALLDKNLADHVLQEVPCLSGLSNDERAKIVGALKTVTYTDSDTVCPAGQVNKCLYIVKDGNVDLVQKGRVIATKKEKEYFGDQALQGDEVPDYDVVARGKCSLFKLSRGELETLVRPVTELATGGAAEAPAVPAPRRKLRTDIKMSDLSEIALLGCGAFGRVTLVKHSKSGKAFALKRISKQHLVDTKQVKNIMFEKEMMTRCIHPFILQLYTTFQDNDSLYMLLEVAPGGEMFNMLADTEEGIVDEPAAQFYAACVTSALECMHGQKIVYRDMKTENLMLDATGYLKVIDLGFAKVVEGKTYTLCGTPEYMAPEVVLGKGHDCAVDYWALGILVYELVVGETPFCDEDMDNMRVCKNIVEEELLIPEDLSDEIASFIANLLERNVTARLGARRGGFDEMWAHPFLADLDDEALLARTITPPINPPCKDDFDLTMFEEAEDMLGARVAKFRGDPDTFAGF